MSKRIPWYGGLWEILIGLTKTSIRKALSKGSMSINEVQTLTADVNAIIDNRFFTFIATQLKVSGPLIPLHRINLYTLQFRL